MQKVETFAPTCNGLVSLLEIVTVLVSSWDGNNARPILKVGQLGPDVASNVSCQTKLLNASIVCFHGGSHTQCIRVTNLI